MPSSTAWSASSSACSPRLDSSRRSYLRGPPMSVLLRRLMYLLRRSRHDADLRDEMEAHRAHRQDALERDGLAPDAAAWVSRRAMGNVTLAVEDARELSVS